MVEAVMADGRLPCGWVAEGSAEYFVLEHWDGERYVDHWFHWAGDGWVDGHGVPVVRFRSAKPGPPTLFDAAAPA